MKNSLHSQPPLFAHIAKRESIIVLFVLLALAVGLNLPAFLVAKDNWSQLNLLSIDEWVYHQALNPIFDALSSHNILRLFAYHGNWGYGYLFFLFSGLVVYPFALHGDISGQIIAARIFSILFLGLASFAVYKIVRLRTSFLPAFLASLPFFLMPAYYFYTKSFSVEFMAVAPLLGAYYFLFADTYRQRSGFFLSAILLGVAIGLKISAAIFAPIIALALFIQPEAKLPQKIKQAILYFSVVGLTFLVTNPFLLTGTGRNYFITQLQENIADNKTGHGGNAHGVTVMSWYLNGVRTEFMNLFFLSVATIAYMKGIYDEWRQKLPMKMITLCALSWLFSLFYILLTVNKIWAYYLFPTFFFSLIGVFALSWPIKKMAVPALLVFLGLLTITNGPNLVSKYTNRLRAEQEPSYVRQKESYDKLAEYIETLTPPPKNILKTAYVYFEEERFPKTLVHPMWGSFSQSHLTTYQPDIILYEKGYDIFESDEKIKTWSSADEVFAGRKLYNDLLGPGVSINGEQFRYQLALETQSVFVLRRVTN